ncbi:restriction endonuclease subunit S [Faecalibacterium hattorii]|uniref:restriction endonuclease subunit S n=1 Tax=Faecalibacterium hattorii TaxID=2935520 RepID=UPI003AAF7C13
MAKLGELGKIITGNTPKTSDAQNYESNDICFVKPSDFTDNEITEIHQSEFYISAYAKDKARVLPTDSILVTCIGIIGKVAINKVPCAFNQQINAIVPEKKVCNPRYIAYAIQNLQPKMQSTANAAVVPILNKTQFSNLEVPLLPVEEQKQIACNLNKIDKLIFLRKQQLEKLDELVKARFVEMFGDPVNNPMNYPKSQLGKVCDVRDGTHDSPEYYDVGYPLVTSKNVTGGKIDLSECNLISEDDYKKTCERSKVDRGDIIMPMIGTVGKPVIVNIEPMFAIKNVALIKFTLDSLVTNIYIKTLLESDYFDCAVLDKIRGGTQKFIALGDIRKLEIILPDLKHQQCFSTFVERVDQQKQTVQQSLEKLELMKKALMQEYFG